MAENKDVKRHIIIGQNGKPQKYTYPKKVIITPNIPARNPQAHGAKLQQELAALKPDEISLSQDAEEYDLESAFGLQISFDADTAYDFEFEKLADARAGIEVLNVTQAGQLVTVSILVPQGKLYVLERKIAEYMDPAKNGKKGPRNHSLLNVIERIRKTAIENLWTDAPELYPQSVDEITWFEVWLPVLSDRLAVVHDFRKLAAVAELLVSDSVLEFPERTVLLVRGSLAALSSSALLLSKISEIRKAKTTADFFDNLNIEEQRAWSTDLLQRANFTASDDSPYVCILDTGVNAEHPLLKPACSAADLSVVDPTWDAADSDGHGTEMAGIALWGDLTDPLSQLSQVEIRHRIESSKLLRYPGDNEGKHLGNITSDGVSEVEIKNPVRKRVYALALSALESRDRGRPSTWSSTVDALASDYLGENQYRRLLLVCAGNADASLSNLLEYPKYNEVQDIHDPAQSWNALTIGAYTRKMQISDADPQQFTLLAPDGGLCPHSSTSILWESDTPIKPEVVFEGGNVAVDDISPVELPSLQLLTTSHDIQRRLFTTFNATSAATGLAAKFAAEILSYYPELWPETVRALMVHSANWTDAMKAQITDPNLKTERQKAHRLARTVGYGVPDLNRALWSLNNSLIMIIQDELQPFEKIKGPPATKDMHLHDLPWPKAELQALGETPVKMTVTLSYFIEPNPSSRNVTSKYRYPSHQLRFDVKRPLESVQDFMQRMTRAAQSEEVGSKKAPVDSNWLLGEFRNKGSVHKDVWSGTAAELADRGVLAIYPAMGWWRTRAKLESYNKKARYALIISIEAPTAEIDLYTPIATALENKVSIPVLTS
ncbi:S8 family peptidase [Alishewanella sp. HH-ZS]|uniref:S8 family peptidase n=1 Tax=Alishewanella sp. HH-ZS TaxID=1856684 RepID=UPI00082362D2|nr:S8 family peptidase [Alishewanella sp. HH-ZS]OCW97064.1 hypothetical protein A9165_08655 [Alishewanella sp. HH-ZS]